MDLAGGVSGTKGMSSRGPREGSTGIGSVEHMSLDSISSHGTWLCLRMPAPSSLKH